MTVVGISDMKIVSGPGVLVTYALGSCIGVCLYDPVVKLAGLIHVMLPCSSGAGWVDNAFKYADTGIAETIRRMEARGGMRKRIGAKIAGGAKMFNIPGDGSFGTIGDKNAKAVIDTLARERIPLHHKDIGGTQARTMQFDAETGGVTIKSFGMADKFI